MTRADDTTTGGAVFHGCWPPASRAGAGRDPVEWALLDNATGIVLPICHHPARGHSHVDCVERGKTQLAFLAGGVVAVAGVVGMVLMTRAA